MNTSTNTNGLITTLAHSLSANHLTILARQGPQDHRLETWTYLMVSATSERLIALVQGFRAWKSRKHPGAQGVALPNKAS